MKYPTLEQIEKAELSQLLKWYTKLPAAGFNYRNTDKLFAKMREESHLIRIITKRLLALDVQFED